MSDCAFDPNDELAKRRFEALSVAERRVAIAYVGMLIANDLGLPELAERLKAIGDSSLEGEVALYDPKRYIERYAAHLHFVQFELLMFIAHSLLDFAEDGELPEYEVYSDGIDGDFDSVF